MSARSVPDEPRQQQHLSEHGPAGDPTRAAAIDRDHSGRVQAVTFVLFFMIGLSGGSAQFASKDLCEAAGARMKGEFQWDDAGLKSGPRVLFFCVESGFHSPGVK